MASLNYIFPKYDFGYNPLSHLSNMETHVYNQLGEGKTVNEIALIGGNSAKTIYAHCDRIRKKLGCTSLKDVAIMSAKQSSIKQLSATSLICVVFVSLTHMLVA